MNPLFSICLAAAATVTVTVTAAPVHLVDQAPATITRISADVSQVDFGRVAFGNLSLNPPVGADATITVHFGEAIAGNRIDRKPPGSVRYSSTKVKLHGSKPVIAAPPADRRNTEQGNGHPPAILTPPEWGVVTPFRWVEIEGWPGEIKPQHITRRAAFSSTWDDDASAFQSSNETLDRIWDLCRYSIKATTFAGVYVDGDRERIPYEADAYLNQLSHYAVEGDIQMARDTFDHLMKHPTWPTEWASHMVFMAHADWMHSGDTKWLAPRYETLKTKLLLDRTRPDGLVVSNKKQVGRDDIVDWPVGERDGFVFKPVNTVINAFHLRSLKLMADMARALGKSADAANYTDLARKAHAAFQETLFDAETGLYRDGEGTDHHSLHANLFPLAFDLVPKQNRSKITEWLGGRGMACSVYAAQYLMEALFKNDAGGKALDLILADNDRSWKHMLESGTTITWEAWDQKYKPNQDWNHAWGAAPANLLPYFVLGARPLTPGWKRTLVSPNPGALESASGKIPTPLGPVLVDWKNDSAFTLKLALPNGMSAAVELPAGEASQGVFGNGKALAARRIGSRWVLESEVSGTVTLEVR
jgi:alpha-L-rhamnosidase